MENSGNLLIERGTLHWGIEWIQENGGGKQRESGRKQRAVLEREREGFKDGGLYKRK